MAGRPASTRATHVPCYLNNLPRGGQAVDRLERVQKESENSLKDPRIQFGLPVGGVNLASTVSGLNAARGPEHHAEDSRSGVSQRHPASSFGPGRNPTLCTT